MFDFAELRTSTVRMDETQSLGFGEFVRAAREALGLSVRQAARDADISEGLWRQIEKGYRQLAPGIQVPNNPRVDTIISMSKALHLKQGAALRAAGMNDVAERIEKTARGDVSWAEPTVRALLDTQGFVSHIARDRGVAGISDEELFNLLTLNREEHDQLQAEVERRLRERR